MANAPFPPPAEVPAPAEAGLIRRGPRLSRHRLVLLHGWGADADDLLDLGQLLVGPEVSVVALQAPLPHPAGQGRQWYDLQQPGWPELPAALTGLRQRLLSLGTEVPLAGTVLLGFSQGAAMAIDAVTGEVTGAGTPDAAPPDATPGGGLPVAGLIGCSGYPHPDWQPRSVQGLASPRILLTHGEQDPVVPVAASVELQRRLAAGGHAVHLEMFQGGHTIDSTLFETLRRFLNTSWS